VGWLRTSGHDSTAAFAIQARHGLRARNRLLRKGNRCQKGLREKNVYKEQ